MTQGDRLAADVHVGAMLQGDGRERLLSGKMDSLSLVQAFASHREAAERRVVEWLRDHERCPFGKSPLFYAEAIERGDHIQENSNGE